MRPGDRIGRYTVLRELARGGMGAVLVAHDPTLGREVAIKLMLALDPSDDPSLLLRFQREAETAARLAHPGIVAVHEAGVDRTGRPFIVQELIEGESLQARLDRQGPLAPLDAALVVRDLARALAYAHARGVVHRDLKPANVLLTPATSAAPPRVFLTDFGVAKDVLARHDLTRTSELLGTATYMAPEQAGEGARRVDARADLYALGAVLYALLTGGPPFDGPSTINILAQVLEAPPEPPSRRRPGIPPPLEALCLRCLQKRPADRPVSAAEVADVLDAIVAGRPPPPPPPPPPPRRALPPLVAPAFMALAAVGLLLWAGLASRRAPPAPAPAPVAATGRPPAAVVVEPDGPARAGWRWQRVTHPDADDAWPALSAVAAAYDPARRAVVLAGGWDGERQRLHADVWTWDGQRITSLPPLPAARSGAAVAALDGRVLVVAGAAMNAVSLADAWAIAPGDLEWTQLHPPQVFTRRARSAVAAVSGGRVLIVGGRADKLHRGLLDDLWELTPAGEWKFAIPGVGAWPSARHSAVAAYDRRRGRLVLFGGEDSVGGYRDDLWEWAPEETRWEPRTGARLPAARAEAAMAYDGARCLLFGGVGGRPDERATLDDLWAWDGERWTEVRVDGERPAARHLAAFAWDERRSVGVLFGGSDPVSGARHADLWELHPPP